jgi:hypothetical protein
MSLKNKELDYFTNLFNLNNSKQKPYVLKIILIHFKKIYLKIKYNYSIIIKIFCFIYKKKTQNK